MVKLLWFIQTGLHSVHSPLPHPSLCWGGVELLSKFQTMGGLAGSQFLEGEVDGKEGDDFFSGKGVAVFTLIN